MKKNATPAPLGLSKELQQEFIQFLEYHPAKQVNRHLRDIFMVYITQCMDAMPLDIKDVIWDMTCLMEMFDVAEEATKDWPAT